MEEGARFLSEDERRHWDEAWKKENSLVKNNITRNINTASGYVNICTPCDVCYSQEKCIVSIERQACEYYMNANLANMYNQMCVEMSKHA
jgi:hypothetical protein